MVEKPTPEQAPSNLTINGRYVLQPQIFDLLAAQERGAGQEIQLTDAMAALCRTQAFYGLQFAGRSFDCGSKIGFLAANITYALARPDLGPVFRKILKQAVDTDPPQLDPSASEMLGEVPHAESGRTNAPDLVAS